MPGLLIRNFPPDIYRKLKDEAKENHRSMSRQALVLIEQALGPDEIDMADIKPFEADFIITQDWLNKVRCEGRK